MYRRNICIQFLHTDKVFSFGMNLGFDYIQINERRQNMTFLTVFNFIDNVLQKKNSGEI